MSGFVKPFIYYSGIQRGNIFLNNSMAFICETCGKQFSRSSNMKRHIDSVHGTGTSHYLGEFKHPFTMIVAGPTGCGKTVWVKSMLKFITPSPERIIWLYGQWQPLYEDLKEHVEFIEGIPDDIGHFLDVNKRNVIIIDDLMTEATQDSRVCDLFTKGSHHRNLSVICLLQNMYYRGKENRTMSLNSHYMVLFKNPRDQQQIAVLARQMYPSNPETLLSKYREATEHPFGYLIIDLKPDTPDSERLKINMQPLKYSAPKMKSDISTQTVANQSVSHLDVEEKGLIRSSSFDSLLDMPSCDNCGIVFCDLHDLQRHVKSWCPVNGSSIDDIRVADDKPISNKDNTVFDDMVCNAYTENTPEAMKVVQMYQDEGMCVQDAHRKARQDFLPKNRKLIMAEYIKCLIFCERLNKNPLHKKIMNTVRALQKEGYDLEEAIKYAVIKREYLFDDLFKMETDNIEDITSDETVSEEE